MHFRKFISLWALLALMLGQVTLAQHSATHIDHGFSQDVIALHDVHDEHQHDQERKKHQCPECVVTKSLQTAFYNAPVTLSFVTQAEALTLQKQSSPVSLKRYKAYSPRAPPAILI